MSDTEKHFKADLDRKLKSRLKFEPNFLTWSPNGKMEYLSVSTIFLISVFNFQQQKSHVFSQAKLVISSLQLLEKGWGAHSR